MKRFKMTRNMKNAILRRLNDGESQRSICQVMDVPRRQVRLIAAGAVNRNTKNGVSRDEWQKMHNLRSDGVSTDQIAIELGRSYETIRRWLQVEDYDARMERGYDGSGLVEVTPEEVERRTREVFESWSPEERERRYCYSAPAAFIQGWD